MIDGTIYAIDPSIKNLNLITKLAECNNIKNIITCELALSDKKEILYTNGVMESNCVFQNDKKLITVNLLISYLMVVQQIIQLKCKVLLLMIYIKRKK